eukprot:752321-Amphidinium_carterae.1
MAATTEQMRELVQEMQRMSARLQAAEQAAGDAGTRVQQTEQTASAAADQAAAAQRQQVAAGGHATRLVDTRSLGRPREFKSVREDWKDWNFQFKAFLCGANPDAGVALDTAGISDQTRVLANLPPIEQELSRQVYLALCLQVSGELVLEFEPRTAGRRRLHVTNLLRPAKTNNMEKLGETIEQWEREVRYYEKVCKTALDEEIKIGVLAYLASDKVSEHPFLFADKLQSYADARKVVFEFLDAHRAQHAAFAAAPMRWTWTP